MTLLDGNWLDGSWLGWSGLEWLANGFYSVSVVLAARNSIHTWWTGMAGCALFAVVFFNVRLYADTTLMLIFLCSSALGWWQWQRGKRGEPLAITRTRPLYLPLFLLPALFITLGYGTLLHQLTDAYAPFWDSAVLGCSLLAQFLLLRRKLETWAAWIIVNLLAIPLYFSRELYLTAAVYLAYLINAGFGWWIWHQQLQDRWRAPASPSHA